MRFYIKSTIIFQILFLIAITGFSQAKSNFKIIGYYAGPSNKIDSFEINKLTHLIFCFSGLKGNKINIRSADDNASIKKMEIGRAHV